MARPCGGRRPPRPQTVPCHCGVAFTLVLVHTAMAAAAAATATTAPQPTPAGVPLTAASVRSALPPTAWAFHPFDAANPRASGTTVDFPFGSLTLGSAAEFPALSAAAGGDLSYILVRIHAGAVAPAHVHPRAAELAFVLSGAVEVAWTDELGTAPASAPAAAAAGRRVASPLRRHDAAVVPRALPHSVACVSADACVVLAVLNAGDPGTAFLASSVCAMGGRHAGGALRNLTAPAVDALCGGGVV